MLDPSEKLRKGGEVYLSLREHKAHDKALDKSIYILGCWRRDWGAWTQYIHDQYVENSRSKWVTTSILFV